MIKTLVLDYFRDTSVHARRLLPSVEEREGRERISLMKEARL